VDEPTEIVIVEVPAPGAAMEDGLKLAVAPAGRPLADREIIASNPPETVVVAVAVPAPPCATVTEAGLTAKEKAGLLLEVTVSETEVVSVRPPPLPVIVMV
jgi:hypothetical protein